MGKRPTEVSARSLVSKVQALLESTADEATTNEVVVSICGPHAICWTKAATREPDGDFRDFAEKVAERIQQIVYGEPRMKVESLAVEVKVDGFLSGPRRRATPVPELMAATARDLIAAIGETLDAREEQIRMLRQRLRAIRTAITELSPERILMLLSVFGEERFRQLVNAAYLDEAKPEAIREAIARGEHGEAP